MKLWSWRWLSVIAIDIRCAFWERSSWRFWGSPASIQWTEDKLVGMRHICLICQPFAILLQICILMSLVLSFDVKVICLKVQTLSRLVVSLIHIKPERNLQGYVTLVQRWWHWWLSGCWWMIVSLVTSLASSVWCHEQDGRDATIIY